MKGPGEDFGMRHLLVLVPTFLWALVVWHDLCGCNRRDFTVIFISKDCICLYYMNVMWLILPRIFIISFLLQAEHLFAVNLVCNSCPCSLLN